MICLLVELGLDGNCSIRFESAGVVVVVVIVLTDFDGTGCSVK